jgi:predicted transposase YbfD/YdcC
MTAGGQVIAQREGGRKTNEITVFKPLLAPLDLAGTVVTFDALHSQTEHARFLVEDKQAHYIAVIKGNHPTLQQELKRLPWREVPLQVMTRATAHGRDEIRRIKTRTVARGLDFPHAAQAVQVVRRRQTVTTGKVTLERVYDVTSLRPHQAAPTNLASWVRGHWGIENRLHFVRDTTLPRTPPACAQAPLPGRWPACATSPSAHSGTQATTTSPPGSATTPAIPAAHSPCSASHDQTG